MSVHIFEIKNNQQQLLVYRLSEVQGKTTPAVYSSPGLGRKHATLKNHRLHIDKT
jgi:hypothetical protein